MEIEYIVKIAIFVILGGLGLYFLYRESLELEEEVLEHEKQCKQEIQKWRGANQHGRN